ncbi:MAG TPA: hypothetical protein VGM77_04660 [Gemmatimonadales bacterium]|jgi:putative N6-adenine-specific DNA methylase
MPAATTLSCFATSAPGLERWLAQELTALGITVTATEPGGVEFTATPRQVADALLWLRTANRLTIRLATFSARTFAELERHAAKVTWPSVLAPEQAVHFRVTSKKSRLYHQDGIAERLEKSVLAQLPGATAVRSASAAEEMETPVSELPHVQRVVVRVLRDEVTLSADASGALLHLRGYRQAVAKAPLRETLAASLLLASGWTADMPLLDLMCGSGTIPIEAALLARQMAPGRARRFAAELWTGWASAFAEARAAATLRELPHASIAVAGQDRDAGAIAASVANAERAGVGADVAFTQAAISHTTLDEGAGWIVTNPPYGARVGEKGRLRDLYATLGAVMRERRPHWRLAMIGADRVLEGQLGIAMEDVAKTENGGIAVRVVRAAGSDG